MRTLTDKRRLLHAAILLSIGLGAFAVGWMTWSGSPRVDCTGPGMSERAIHECVAREAQATEPNTATLLALGVGAIAVSAAIVMLGRAVRRVISLADAAQRLGMSPGAVRQLVDEGTLQIYEQRVGATYLYAQQVHRYAVESSGPFARAAAAQDD